MDKVALVARVLLGLVFVVFGLNGFFNFLPPPDVNEAGMSFIGTLMGSGYLMTLIKLVEIVSGLMILTGKFLPLGLTILAPVSLNILLFHVFIDPNGMPIAIVIIVLQLLLAWHYRDSFAGVLNPNAKPTGS